MVKLIPNGERPLKIIKQGRNEESGVVPDSKQSTVAELTLNILK